MNNAYIDGRTKKVFSTVSGRQLRPRNGIVLVYDAEGNRRWVHVADLPRLDNTANNAESVFSADTEAKGSQQGDDEKKKDATCYNNSEDLRRVFIYPFTYTLIAMGSIGVAAHWGFPLLTRLGEWYHDNLVMCGIVPE